MSEEKYVLQWQYSGGSGGGVIPTWFTELEMKKVQLVLDTFSFEHLYQFIKIEEDEEAGDE